MTEPATPTPDDKDWTWVLRETCPDCGYDAARVSMTDLPDVVGAVVDRFVAQLSEPEAAARPAPAVWSPLEYACHIRDVCRMFRGRLDRMLTEDDPLFANWDQDDTAREERYWEQDPALVSTELRAAAVDVADAFAAVPPDRLDRPGRRSDGASFTVDRLGRYFAHDLVHHEWDVR
jgi:hypothetical protein